MKRIGIMGGTFNPIHSVHLIMAQVAYKKFHLDKILFMPSKNPPHKDNREIVSDAHRTRMIQLAIDGNNHFEFSDMELKREGTTYTSDTLTELTEKNPDTEYYFIIGGDSLWQLENWHEPETIFQKCHIIAARRGQVKRKEFRKKIAYYEEKYNAQISQLEMENIHISSKGIREHIQNGEPYSYYCPDKVSKYIAYHGLYGFCRPTKAHLSMLEIHSMLKCIFRPKRFLHILGVQYTSTSLAMAYHCDVKQAELAGVLHDCGKYLTFEEQLEACEKHGVELAPVEVQNPALIHAKLGAAIAKEKYNVCDEEILNAIRYHTTGRKDMSLLEKIIYIADYIEPNRTMDCSPYSLEQIRREAFRSLDKTLCMILENSILYLQSRDAVIDSLTLETYEYYKQRVCGGKLDVNRK